MKKIWLNLLVPLVVSANTLDIRSGSLVGPLTTSSSSFAQVLSVGYDMPSAGSALVLSSYSAQSDTSTKGLMGSWRLYDAAHSASSATISRSLSTGIDIGIASSMHVFSGLSTGANSLALQHSTTAGSMNTLGANLVVIPLVTSGGDSLNYGLEKMDASQAVASTVYGDSGLLTTVTVDRSTGNGIYIATSFNTRTTGSSAEIFNSQLQYRKGDSGDWINIGAGNRRSLSGENDTGSITLYGAIDGLDQGSYQVRVAGSTVGGTEVEVLNGELAAVAMSYSDTGMDGGYFEMVGATSAGGENTENTFEPIPGVLGEVDAQENEDIFASMSFGGSAAQGANQTASFRLSITNETGLVQSTVENSRYFSKTDDYGSGSAVGVFSNLTAGTYTIIGEHDEDAGPTFTESITLVGFGTQAVPEPTTMALVSLAGLIALLWRRWANR